MHRYQSIDQVYGVVNSDLSMTDKLERIAQIMVETEKLGVERCAIIEILDGGLYRLIAGVALMGPPHELNKSHAISECPPILEVILTEESVTITNPRSDNRTTCYLSGLMETLDMKSIHFAPVFIKGEINHLIVLDAIRQKNSFSDEDKDFINLIAKKIGDLRKFQQQLKHKNRLDIVMLTLKAVMHEIRNPLTAAAGMAYRALKHAKKIYPNDSALIHYLEIDIKESMRIEQLIKSVSGLFNGFDKLQLIESDINALINGLLILPEISSRKKVKINFAANTLAPHILIDPSQTMFALGNLITNSLNLIEKNEGISPEQKIMDIVVNMSKTHVKLSISGPDNIENPELIFEPLGTRAPTNENLFLSITKSIIEAHGASVRASKNNGDTRFTVNFPITK